MAYTTLNIVKTGIPALILHSQLYNTDDSINGSVITNWEELQKGEYKVVYSIPDDFVGYMKIYDSSDNYITSASIDNSIRPNNVSSPLPAVISGIGSYVVTATVTDGTNPIQNAFVSMLQGTSLFVATTNISGQATFSLNVGSYSVTATASGYSFTPTTKIISGTTNFTIVMSTIVITPSIPPLTTAYGTIYDGIGNPVPNITLRYTLYEADGPGNLYVGTYTEATSDINGLITVSIYQNATYEISLITGEIVSPPITLMTTTSANPFAMPSFFIS